MLYPYSADSPIYFGCRFKPIVKQRYMSNEYILSREGVRRFVEEALPNENMCRSGFEDFEIGQCVEKVGVLIGDSDGKFLPCVSEQNLSLNKQYWIWQYKYYKSVEGSSDHTILFHYISPNQMYVLDYFIYHLRPYGVRFTYTMALL